MIVVRGRAAGEMTRGELDALVAGRPVTVDLGAGDGMWAYRHARAQPERFVVAIDPVRENLREASAKAAKKPERGGAPNLLYVAASVELLPEGLRGVAEEVFVTLPWGSLMRALILADGGVLDAVASLGTPGARLRIVLNTRIFDDPVPIEARGLPELSPDYARGTLARAYAAHGIEVAAARWMDADEVAALGTTWAKRLSHRAPPRSLLIAGIIDAGQDGEDAAARGHQQGR